MMKYAVDHLREADGIIASRGGNRDEAEDASQSAFVKILARKPVVRNKSAYWKKAVLNTWIDERRRHYHRNIHDFLRFPSMGASKVDEFAIRDELADVARVLRQETPMVQLAVRKRIAGVRMSGAERIAMHRLRKRLEGEKR